MHFRTFVVMPKKGGTDLGTLYERIQTLCKQKGVSASRMCLDLGLSKSTMSDMKYGRIKGISMPTAQKIAGYFGISVDDLYGAYGNENKPTETDELTETQREAMELIMQMSDEQLRVFIATLKAAMK